LPAGLAETPFQIDHIIPRKHGGRTTADNLALSCFYCNSYKGPNLSGIDPMAEQIVTLFHPKRDRWEDHFQWLGPLLRGLTPVGRATITVLNINH
jgi:5-methylcytosine-specific restriction endonuclease McrA